MSADQLTEWDADLSAHRQNNDTKGARKRALLAPHVRGQDVLHLGAGGGSVGRPDDHSDWLHGWLDDVAASAVGIDVDAAAVTAAQRFGYDVREADAQDFALGETFDVVAAPNVIEHVSNPGQLVACAREHLRPGGELLITTDRITIPWWTLQALRNGGCPGTCHEHVCAFTRDHLERLCDRQGMAVTHYESWGFDREGVTRADKAWRVIERQLARVWPHVEHVQHFVVAEPAEGKR